jgi:hypothetical protein
MTAAERIEQINNTGNINTSGIIEDAISERGDRLDNYNTIKIELEYRLAIVCMLPYGVILCENGFMGLFPRRSGEDFMTYIGCDLSAIVGAVDLDEILDAHLR